MVKRVVPNSGVCCSHIKTLVFINNLVKIAAILEEPL